MAYYCHYHIPENSEDFPGYGNIKALQESPEKTFLFFQKSFLHGHTEGQSSSFISKNITQVLGDSQL